MEFLKKITDFIQDLEEKDFYKYTIILLVSLLMIVSFMVYRYYSQESEYTQEIERINDIRNDSVKNILARLKTVRQLKKGADDMLKKEADFKIRDFFNKLLAKLNLTEYRKEEGTLAEKEVDEYMEIEVSNIGLNGMGMEQLCGLLNELEKTPRIRINLLDIKKSQKTDAIDVNLTISTLLPKTESATS